MGAIFRFRNSRLSRTVPAALVVVLILSPSAEGSTGTPTPSPTGTTPTTMAPPDGSPVDEVIGGDQLATIGSPVVSPDAPPLPSLDAGAWLIADVDTADVLAALNAHERRPPASTIKLLTALATIDTLDPEVPYLANIGDVSVEGSRVGLLDAHSYSIDDLLHGLLLASGNDAAHAIAEAAGGQQVTVDLMNAEAERIGAFDTHAATPHGLDSPGQLSSAYDLALIGRQALADETIARLATTTSYNFPGAGSATFQIQNQNRLLGAYDGAIGLKTGYTTLARHTFVGAAKRGGRTLIVVVLGAEGRAEKVAAALLDWGFAADDVAEVGTLVTPDQVAAMVDRAENDGQVVRQDPLDELEDVLGGSSSTSSGVPGLVWISLSAATLAGGIGFAVRRRATVRRNTQRARYASPK